MNSLLQLHLQTDSAKPEAENLPKAANEEPKTVITSKRLNRIVTRAAHKAAKEYGRSSGIFSK
jgi:hypothetical protein